ncbi:hypothetical protein EDB80DRAFT_230132 [Ilyonectria destructans]|nr:hypothetical protein EDB80DRAFT_230132 [Ilyonectria destructans]
MPITVPLRRCKQVQTLVGRCQSEDIEEDSVIYVNPQKPVSAWHSPNEGKRRRLGSKRFTGTAKRSISFEDVFQDGRATIKHIIVQFPAGDGSWYILRCDKHDLSFKNHPIKGAAKHLGGKQHGRMSRKPSVAIKHLGVKVLNCNKILAEKNNIAALEALQKEHKHPTADMVDNEPQGDLIPTSVYKAPARKTQESQGRAGKALLTDGSSQQVTDVEVITEPIPGEFYLAYRKGSTDRCPVLLLPLGHLDNVGVPDAVEILGLIDSVPACYVYNQSVNDLVWQEGYEDDGPLVAKRQFPVMYLDGSEFPNRGLVGWVGVEDLRPFDVQGSDSSLVRQCNSVRDFLRKRAETTSEDTATDFNILLED